MPSVSAIPSYIPTGVLLSEYKMRIEMSAICNSVRCCHLVVHTEYASHLPALLSCWWCLWVIVAADADLCSPRTSVRLRFSCDNMPAYPMHTQSLFPQSQGSRSQQSLVTVASNGPTVPAADARWLWLTGETKLVGKKPAPVPLFTTNPSLGAHGESRLAAKLQSLTWQKGKVKFLIS
jgi:hypothetical protein